MLHRIAPLGLAAAAGTALVVDLDPDAAPYPGPALADLSAGAVRAEHLAPKRRGVAVISSGGVTTGQADELLERLISGWPAVVIRVPVGSAGIPVLPLEPVELRPPKAIRAVWQSTVRGSTAPGVVLPPIGRSRVTALCRCVVEPRWRWVRAWSAVWERPWA